MSSINIDALDTIRPRSTFAVLSDREQEGTVQLSCLPSL